MVKCAYLLPPYRGAIQIPQTRVVYQFDPWCEVADEHWAYLASKTFLASGCGGCGRKRRQVRVFGSEEEIRTGVCGFLR